MEDFETAQQALDLLLTQAHGAPDAAAASEVATDLCRLLAACSGGAPARAVARTEMPDVLERVGAIARLLGVDRIVAASRETGLSVELRHWLISLAAAPGSLRYEPEDDDLVVTAEGAPVAALSELTVTIETTTLRSGRLDLDARVAPTTLFAPAPLIVATIAGRDVSVETTGEYAGFRLFGHRMLDGQHVRLAMDLPDFPQGGTLRFVARTSNGATAVSTPLPLVFGLYSHLSLVPGMHWRRCGWCLTALERGVGIRPISRAAAAMQEAALIAKLLTSGRKIPTVAGMARTAYWLARPVLSGDRIWLAHDKMYSGGDCGEYMYWHLERNRDGFVPFYAINRDAPEVPRLRAAHARLVHPGTIRHFLRFLNAEVIFATHANPVSYNGLGGRRGLYIRDLLDARIVCIQHGLSMQDQQPFQHRTHANTERYYCASKYEVANMLAPAYGYSPQQMVLTGIPRFDGLHSRPARRVMVSPTWRPEFAGSSAGIMNRQRPASERFAETPFFRLYTEVLTHPRLRACARETGYAIDFVMHPYLAKNAGTLIGRLDEHGEDGADVRVVVTGVDASYEELLVRSDLMVTDFSGVQYDFAYMGKPVVYFHPPELPSQYGHGAMDFDTMGFGEVLDTVEQLVDTLCDYMRRDCAIDPRFAARIDDFFEYRDDHNCARILADITAYLSHERAR